MIWTVILTMLFGKATATAQHCISPDFKAKLGKVQTDQSGLLAYKLHDEMDEEVPGSLQSQIRGFKDALAALGDAAADCAAVNEDPKTLEGDLAGQLGANKPVTEEIYNPNKVPQNDHIYGDGLRVRVTEPLQPVHLLLVEFGFGIDCGDDSLLMIYENHSGQWRRTLRWQSDDYSEVKDAFGDFFQYVVIPRSSRDGWLLAAAHGSPWCTSRWSGFGLDLVQPATSNAPQKTLQHVEHGYVRGDTAPILKLVPGGFQLRVETGMLDMDVMTRIGIYRYRVSGDKPERVQPIAINGRDFVDEWLQSPWGDAARWSSPEALATLRDTHRQLGEKTPDTGRPNYTFGPVRGCSDSSAHFQVELKAEWIDDKGNSKPAGTTYFGIKQGINSFTMLSGANTPDSQCNGIDIMKTK